MEPLKKDLKMAQSGDGDAFERLLDQYTPLIRSAVTKFMSSLSASRRSIEISEEDLTQEAAIALYLSALSYDEEKNVTFGQYAKTGIKHRLINYVRRFRRVKGPEPVPVSIEDCPEEEPADPDCEPLNAMITRESFEEFRKTVKDILTEREYQIFIMTADGDSPAQISKKLGINVKSVYNAIQRGKSKLKKSTKNTTSTASDAFDALLVFELDL